MKKQGNKGRELLKPSPNEEVCIMALIISIIYMSLGFMQGAKLIQAHSLSGLSSFS